jgi:hypothetical protein
MHRELASKNSPILVLVMCTLSLAWNVLVLFFGEEKDRMLIPNHHNHSGLDSLYSLATYHGCCRLGDLNSLPITNHSPFPSSSLPLIILATVTSDYRLIFLLASIFLILQGAEKKGTTTTSCNYSLLISNEVHNSQWLSCF